MQKITTFFFITLFLLTGSVTAFAAENEFKKNNPDVLKYEFARSYISALRYFHENSVRWEKNPPKKKYGKEDLKVIKISMDYLTMDNINLRVAKNYMTKYMDSANSMQIKVSDMLIVACDTDIALNNKSKNLWQDWLNVKVQRKPTAAEEKDFIERQREIEFKRKESDKSIIKASIMLTKVLLSQENLNEKGKLLALTAKERNKLLDILDEFGKDVMDWDVKTGQSTLEASIAVIRGILEDPIFISHT